MTETGWQSLDNAPLTVKALGEATRDHWKPGDGRIKIGYGPLLDAYVFWMRPGKDPLWTALPTLPDEDLPERVRDFVAVMSGKFHK